MECLLPGLPRPLPAAKGVVGCLPETYRMMLVHRIFHLLPLLHSVFLFLPEVFFQVFEVYLFQSLRSCLFFPCQPQTLCTRPVLLVLLPSKPLTLGNRSHVLPKTSQTTVDRVPLPRQSQWDILSLYCFLRFPHCFLIFRFLQPSILISPAGINFSSCLPQQKIRFGFPNPDIQIRNQSRQGVDRKPIKTRFLLELPGMSGVAGDFSWPVT